MKIEISRELYNEIADQIADEQKQTGQSWMPSDAEVTEWVETLIQDHINDSKALQDE